MEGHTNALEESLSDWNTGVHLTSDTLSRGSQVFLKITSLCVLSPAVYMQTTMVYLTDMQTN